MSVDDYSKLKKLALAATPGTYGVVGPKPGKGVPDWMVFNEGGELVAESALEADADYIAAADPTTVLALLAEREADKAEIAELHVIIDSLPTVDTLRETPEFVELVGRLERAEAEIVRLSARVNLFRDIARERAVELRPLRMLVRELRGHAAAWRDHEVSEQPVGPSQERPCCSHISKCCAADVESLLSRLVDE